MIILKIILVIIYIAACWGGIALLADLLKKPTRHMPNGLYERCIKRGLDAFLSIGALIVFSPILLMLMIVGAIKMGGNPFFTQERPGKDEKIFKLIKFRTMDNRKDENGNLLPDEVRLNSYGKWLRATSLDELPELINMVKGDMAVVGPRPLLEKYLPRYNAHQARRHEVRPGFTGLAQVHGRNAISWEEKFDWDVKYIDSITFKGDFEIVLDTVKTVLKHEGISSETSVTMEEFIGTKEQNI